MKSGFFSSLVYVLVLPVFALTCVSASAQTIDEQMATAEQAATDSLKVMQLNKIAAKIAPENTAKALEIVNRSMEHAGKNLLLQAETYRTLGLVYRENQRTDKSIDAYKQALKIYQDLDKQKSIAAVYEKTQLLNISVSTVSRGLHDHPSIGLTTRQKIKKLAKELNYEPNQTAIFLQKGSTQTIGVILPELSEAFFSTAVSAIEDTAYKRNYTVLLAQSHDDEQLEKQLVEKMKNHRVDGLLVSVGKSTSSYQHFERLKQYDIPIVFFDRIPAMPNIHYVACNMETGTVEAVSYLLKKGHRNIGMINGPSTIFASSERKGGYIKALAKNRLKFDPSLIVSCDLTEAGTRDAMDNLLSKKRKPTAIVTFNDYVALFAIKYAAELKLSIGKDLEFVSYANLPMINFMEKVPTASVEQFPYMQGQKAADILLDLLNNKQRGMPEQTAYYKIIIESQLVESRKPITYKTPKK